MLADLPAGGEAAASRSDLIYTLASYYWAKDEFDKSHPIIKEGLKLVSGMNDRSLRIAILVRDRARIPQSKESSRTPQSSYQRAVDLNPYNTHAWNNLAILITNQGDIKKPLKSVKNQLN